MSTGRTETGATRRSLAAHGQHSERSLLGAKIQKKEKYESRHNCQNTQRYRVSRAANDSTDMQQHAEAAMARPKSRNTDGKKGVDQLRRMWRQMADFVVGKAPEYITTVTALPWQVVGGLPTTYQGSTSLITRYSRI